MQHFYHQLLRLQELKPGWYNGERPAFSEPHLKKFAQNFSLLYPKNALLPHIFPGDHEKFFLDWPLISSPTLDVQLVPMTAQFHAFSVNEHPEIRQIFDLSSSEAWHDMVNTIKPYILKP